MAAWNTRFRFIVLLILAATLIGLHHGSPQPSLRDWPAFALAALFAAGLFLLSPRALGVATAAMFAIALTTVYFYPQMVSVLLVSLGMTGSRLSWPRLRLLGLPLVLLAALAWAAGGAGGLHWATLLSSSTLNIVIAFGAVLLLGRMASDANEARRAEAAAHDELRQAHEELKRQAAQAEELAALQERTRLSRELHDTLGHALSAITVQLEAVRRLSAVDPAKAQSLIGEAQGAARAAMGDLRAHLAQLRSQGAPADLKEALANLAAASAERNGWQLRLDLGDVPTTDAQRWTLLQVAREALTNAERHAGACEVAMSLGQEGGEICLKVEDDGCGVPQPLPTEGHFGIPGMRERMREGGGSVRIEERREGGTRVLARLPQGGWADG